MTSLIRGLYDTEQGTQGKECKNNIKTGKGTKHKRLLNMENKQRVTGGLVGGRDWLNG